MKSNNTFAAWRGFMESLVEEIYSNQSSIPLQNLCREGNADLEEDPQITNLILCKLQDCKIFGRFTISFCEVSKTGCSEKSWKEKRTAEIDFVFDTMSGIVTFIEGELYSNE